MMLASKAADLEVKADLVDRAAADLEGADRAVVWQLLAGAASTSIIRTDRCTTALETRLSMHRPTRFWESRQPTLHTSKTVLGARLAGRSIFRKFITEARRRSSSSTTTESTGRIRSTSFPPCRHFSSAKGTSRKARTLPEQTRGSRWKFIIRLPTRLFRAIRLVTPS